MFKLLVFLETFFLDNKPEKANCWKRNCVENQFEAALRTNTLQNSSTLLLILINRIEQLHKRSKCAHTHTLRIITRG